MTRERREARPSASNSSARSAAPSASAAPKPSASIAESSAPSPLPQTSASAVAANGGGPWSLFEIPGPKVDKVDLFEGSYKETVIVPKGWKQAKGGGADMIFREDKSAFFVLYNANAAKLDDKKLSTILAFAPLQAKDVTTKDTADNQPVGADKIPCRVGRGTARRSTASRRPSSGRNT